MTDIPPLTLKKLDKDIQQALSEYTSILNLENKDLTLRDNIREIFNYYKNILACMPGYVYWMDRNCKGLGCNQNVLTILGLSSPEEFIGLTLDEMGELLKECPKEAIQSFKRDTMEVIRTGRGIFNVEEPPILDQQGNLVYLLTSRVPLFSSQREVIGVVGISINVTAERDEREQDTKHAQEKLERANQELRAANELARAANQLKTEFIENLQHDIRTPAAGIVAVLSTLIENETEDEKRKLLKLLNQSAKRLLEVCNEVIDFSKVERGEVILTSKRFHLPELLKSVVELYQAAVFKKNLSLIYTCDPAIPSIVRSDPHRLSRILINLVGNAIKFTDAGSIHLSAQLIEQKDRDLVIQFKIEDTGKGIPEHKKNYMYEKFNRVTPDHRGAYKGSGLGLQIVKKFVHELEGEIEVVSHLGKGTTFYIHLPFQEALDQSFPEDHPDTHFLEKFLSPTETRALSTVRNVNILLIEDDRLSQLGALHVLQKAGLQPTLATSMTHAIDLLTQQHFEGVISDLNLLDGSGFDVLYTVKNNAASLNAKTPFFALTAYIDEKTHQQALSAGFAGVFLKPLNLEILQKAMDKHLVAETTQSC